MVAYSIMSNHIHILFDSHIEPIDIEIKPDPFLGCLSLANIMKRIKGPISRFSNKVLGKNGKFFAHESFDMYIRNEKMYSNVIRYILNNPIKAGIAEKWEDYDGNYFRIPHSPSLVER